jgi:hypothetical protein
MLTSVISGNVHYALLVDASRSTCWRSQDYNSVGPARSWPQYRALSIAALATSKILIGLRRIRPAAPTPKLGNLHPNAFKVT